MTIHSRPPASPRFILANKKADINTKSEANKHDQEAQNRPSRQTSDEPASCLTFH